MRVGDGLVERSSIGTTARFSEGREEEIDVSGSANLFGTVNLVTRKIESTLNKPSDQDPCPELISPTITSLISRSWLCSWECSQEIPLNHPLFQQHSNRHLRVPYHPVPTIVAHITRNAIFRLATQIFFLVTAPTTPSSPNIVNDATVCETDIQCSRSFKSMRR